MILVCLFTRLVASKSMWIFSVILSAYSKSNYQCSCRLQDIWSCTLVAYKTTLIPIYWNWQISAEFNASENCCFGCTGFCSVAVRQHNTLSTNLMLHGLHHGWICRCRRPGHQGVKYRCFREERRAHPWAVVQWCLLCPLCPCCAGIIKPCGKVIDRVLALETKFRENLDGVGGFGMVEGRNESWGRVKCAIELLLRFIFFLSSRCSWRSLKTTGTPMCFPLSTNS